MHELTKLTALLPVPAVGPVPVQYLQIRQQQQVVRLWAPWCSRVHRARRLRLSEDGWAPRRAGYAPSPQAGRAPALRLTHPVLLPSPHRPCLRRCHAGQQQEGSRLLRGPIGGICLPPHSPDPLTCCATQCACHKPARRPAPGAEFGLAETILAAPSGDGTWGSRSADAMLRNRCHRSFEEPQWFAGAALRS